MKFTRLEQRVMRDEGFRGTSYKDTVDIWTVGYGSTRLFGVPVKETTICTTEQARAQLRADLYQAIIDCEKLFDTWETLDSIRQEILVNMCYNLGSVGLSNFRNMRSAIRHQEWKRAAEEMVDSKWYSQVGGRGQRLVAAMKSGKWIEDLNGRPAPERPEV